MKITQKNFTCLLSNFNKHNVNINDLTNLLEESPLYISVPDPSAPLIIQYQNSGLFITIVNNKLEINVTNLNLPFEELTKKILIACNDQRINAYGYNYNYREEKEINLVEHFNIKVNVNTFKLMRDNFIKYSFSKDDTIYNLDLSDGKGQLLAHINVHHNKQTTPSELAKNIKDSIKHSITESYQLLKEVLGD